MHIATFTAQLRRPRPVSMGMMALMFARNGADADAVMGLGKSDLLDAKVEVDLGEDMGAFKAYLRRPKPSDSGFMAQFFGESGPQADVITALGLSSFIDKDFEIIVTQLERPDGSAVPQGDKPSRTGPRPTKPNSAGIALASRTPTEIVWKSAMWGLPEVWSRIGSDANYQYWQAGRNGDLKGAYQMRREWAWSTMKIVAQVPDFTGYTALQWIALLEQMELEQHVPTELRQLSA